MTLKAGSISILGMWLLVATFAVLSAQSLFWNNLLVGFLVIIAGSLMAFSGRRSRRWQGWIAVFLGTWLFFSTFIPVLSNGKGLYWNNLVISMTLIIDAATAYPPEQHS